MITPNTRLQLCRGTRIRVGSLLGAGGEGLGYNAVDERSGRPGAFRLFKCVSGERVHRTRFLVAQRLSEVSEFFCGPTDYYDNHRLGHFAPLATGITLDEHLGKAGASYPETIKLAIALVHGHALLSQHDLAHGDPCLGQVKIRCTPSGPEIAIYDFDDYAAPGVPPPPCYGREGRLTPELRLAMNGGPPCPPDELSDRYAITTMMHELLLGKN